MVVSAHSMDTTFYVFDEKDKELCVAYTGEDGVLPQIEIEEHNSMEIVECVEQVTHSKFNKLKNSIKKEEFFLSDIFYSYSPIGEDINKDTFLNGYFDLAGNYYVYSKGDPYYFGSDEKNQINKFLTTISKNFRKILGVFPSIPLVNGKSFNVNDISSEVVTHNSEIDVWTLNKILYEVKHKKFIEVFYQQLKKEWLVNNYNTTGEINYLFIYDSRKILENKNLLYLCCPDIKKYIEGTEQNTDNSIYKAFDIHRTSALNFVSSIPDNKAFIVLTYPDMAEVTNVLRNVLTTLE